MVLVRFDCETTIFFCVCDLKRVPSLSSVILKIYICISASRAAPRRPAASTTPITTK